MSVERNDDEARKSSIQEIGKNVDAAPVNDALVEERDAKSSFKPFVWIGLIVLGLVGFFVYRGMTGIEETPETAIAALVVVFLFLMQFMPLLLFYVIYKRFKFFARTGAFKSKEDLLELLHALKQNSYAKGKITSGGSNKK